MLRATHILKRSIENLSLTIASPKKKSQKFSTMYESVCQLHTNVLAHVNEERVEDHDLIKTVLSNIAEFLTEYCGIPKAADSI